MMVNDAVVGLNGVNFVTSYKADRSGNITSGEWFRKAELEGQKNHGPLTRILMIILTHDKTQMGNGDAWPFNMCLGNSTTAVLTSDIGSKLVGFVPGLPCNDEKMRKYLKEAGVSTQKGFFKHSSFVNFETLIECIGICYFRSQACIGNMQSLH